MDIKNLILVVIAVLNFFVGLIVILRNYKNKINVSFALLLFSVVGWSIALAMSRELAGTLEALKWSRSSYYFAIFIAYFFLSFTLVFPYVNKGSTKIRQILSALPLLFVLVILLKGNLMITGLTEKPWGYDISYGQIWYLFYSTVFAFYMLWAYINLAIKRNKAIGYTKFQVSVVLYGFVIAGLFGTIFDLILPYYNYWKLNWLGPYFTIILLFVIAYLLFYNPKQDK